MRPGTVAQAAAVETAVPVERVDTQTLPATVAPPVTAGRTETNHNPTGERVVSSISRDSRVPSLSLSPFHDNNHQQ